MKAIACIAFYSWIHYGRPSCILGPPCHIKADTRAWAPISKGWKVAEFETVPPSARLPSPHFTPSAVFPPSSEQFGFSFQALDRFWSLHPSRVSGTRNTQSSNKTRAPSLFLSCEMAQIELVSLPHFPLILTSTPPVFRLSHGVYWSQPGISVPIDTQGSHQHPPTAFDVQ